jgi:hypothetical protein
LRSVKSDDRDIQQRIAEATLKIAPKEHAEGGDDSVAEVEARTYNKRRFEKLVERVKYEWEHFQV